MLIAIDYDFTYTNDPDLWDDFIHNAKSRGHEVICVTMRYEKTEGEEVLNSIGKYCRVIFTERMAKRRFLLDMGISPAIWIDDCPIWIYENGK